MLLYTQDKFDQIKEALIKFERKTDAKAAAMVSISYIWGQVSRLVAMLPLVRTEATHATALG